MQDKNATPPVTHTSTGFDRIKTMMTGSRHYWGTLTVANAMQLWPHVHAIQRSDAGTFTRQQSRTPSL